jgi:peptide/nickel transport system substrate-binding protein
MRLRRDGSRRYLTTVLFVDIVGSTEHASTVGDARWRDLLGQYLGAVRERLRHHHGREIDTAGDGLFAAFDVPADGLACAFDIRDAAEAIGLRVRAGMHMGEVQTIAGKAGGIAVHIGARIAAVAEPGEILASSTIRDLVTGSGIRFEDRGSTALKGVPEPWHLYAAIVPAAIPAPADDVDAAIAAGAGRRVGSSPSVASHRFLVGGIVAVVAIALGGVLFMAAGRASPSPSSSDEAAQGTPPATSVPVTANSLSVIDPADGRVTSSVAVGTLPDQIAVGGDAVWVTDTTAGSVVQLDDAGTAVERTIPVGDDPTGIAYGFGAVWVALEGDAKVVRIDPAAHEVVDEIAVGNGPTSVAVDETSVWVTDRLDGRLVRIDPTTDQVTDRLPVANTPVAVAAAGGSVWVVDHDAGMLVEVDARSGAVTQRIRVGNGPSAVVASDSAVWVANERDGNVSQIDPQNDAESSRPNVGGSPSGLAIDPDTGRVWVAVPSAGRIVELDPTTGGIEARHPVDGGPRGIAFASDRALFTARPAETSHSGGTLRVVSPASYFPDGRDPQYWTSLDWSGLQMLLLTHDGLVGYKRIGGPDGSTIVPDLAERVPTPSDGGRTYTFHLRPGIRFSDGTVLAASDVRHSLERAVMGQIAVAGSPGGLISIVGADACTETGCDLSSGITTDDEAGSVIIHLADPDPIFLDELAFVSAFIVPGDTPFDQATVPLIGTGPYMVDVAKGVDDPSPEVRLVRNPFFTEWSRDAQPTGHPDVIEWTVAPGDDPSAPVTNGQADLVVGPLSADTVKLLARTHPVQLDVAPSQRVLFEYLNVATPPFDDPNVRLALEYGVDRSHLSELFNGSSKSVTCQIMPPFSPGYEPYCPFTAGATASGTWLAPDLEKARGLMAKSHARGVPVTVWALDDPGFRAVASYLADVLDALGMPATVHLEGGGTYFEKIFDPKSTIQISGLWYLSPSPASQLAFIGSVTCPDFPSPYAQPNPGRFCDPAIDARVEAGVALETTLATGGDPEGDLRARTNQSWAALDRQVTDEAPAITSLLDDVTYVGERVGNVQHHPVWQLVLDQLWVR